MKLDCNQLSNRDNILSTNCIQSNYRKEDADEANRKDVNDMNVNTFLSYLIKRAFAAL